MELLNSGTPVSCPVAGDNSDPSVKCFRFREYTCELMNILAGTSPATQTCAFDFLGQAEIVFSNNAVLDQSGSVVSAVEQASLADDTIPPTAQPFGSDGVTRSVPVPGGGTVDASICPVKKTQQDVTAEFDVTVSLSGVAGTTLNMNSPVEIQITLDGTPAQTDGITLALESVQVDILDVGNPGQPFYRRTFTPGDKAILVNSPNSPMYDDGHFCRYITSSAPVGGVVTDTCDVWFYQYLKNQGSAAHVVADATTYEVRNSQLTHRACLPERKQDKFIFTPNNFVFQNFRQLTVPIQVTVIAKLSNCASPAQRRLLQGGDNVDLPEIVVASSVQVAATTPLCDYSSSRTCEPRGDTSSCTWAHKVGERRAGCVATSIFETWGCAKIKTKDDCLNRADCEYKSPRCQDFVPPSTCEELAASQCEVNSFGIDHCTVQGRGRRAKCIYSGPTTECSQYVDNKACLADSEGFGSCAFVKIGTSYSCMDVSDFSCSELNDKDCKSVNTCAIDTTNRRRNKRCVDYIPCSSSDAATCVADNSCAWVSSTQDGPMRCIASDAIQCSS